MVSLSACTTWGASTRRPNTELQSAQGKRLGRMLVRVADGPERELWNVVIGADSIVGLQLNKDGSRERVALARADLSEVTLRRFELGKTVAFLAGVTATLVLLFMAALYAALAGSST